MAKLLAFILMVGSVAAGDTVLVATTAGIVPQGASFEQNQYLAQQILFCSAVSVSGFTIVFVDGSAAPFPALLQVTDAIGPGANASSVLASDTFDVPAGATQHAATIPLALSLAPGTYYFVLSTTQPLPFQSRWQFTDNYGELAFTIYGTGEAGLIGSSFFSQSQNVNSPYASPFWVLAGGQVPELGSLILFGSGLVFLAGVVRRKRGH